MLLDYITIKGAREHNLKNIDLSIPRGKLIAITGVSGSGKSSLAFDTIYAEGQRRYVESLSAYARQFLGRIEKPDVDYIEGLSPAISIDQKGPSHNPRSTVGTITEIYDYLRLLFARIGHQYCPRCGRIIARQNVQQIVDAVRALPESNRIMILAPIVKDRKGEHQSVFNDLRKAGFVRARVDGYVVDLSDELTLDRNRKHTIEAIVDRLMIGDIENTNRIADSIETALKLGGGMILISIVDGDDMLFSEHYACEDCGISLNENEPRSFSFNSPHGACPECSGIGLKLEVDPDLLMPDKTLSLADGALRVWGWGSWHARELEEIAESHQFSLKSPICNLTPTQINTVLYGENNQHIRYRSYTGRAREYMNGYEGVIPYLERLYRETESGNTRSYIERYMSSHPCPVCNGKRLKPESLSVYINNKNIIDLTELSSIDTFRWFQSLISKDISSVLTQNEYTIAQQILKEISTRLMFIIDIGLGYLTLARPSSTLSGGEAQRIRLATQIGSGLMGVLYVCDEPTIGLHPADIDRLITTIYRLRDLGNTIIIVEHDEFMMRASDYIVDMGPGAGEYGGRVVATGELRDIINNPESITGKYLGRINQIPLPAQRRQGSGKALTIKGARENNLNNINVDIPLNKLVCVTGVSGSGKSTLINDVLYKKLAHHFYHAKDKPGQSDSIIGMEHIDKVVNIDQSPIGRTSRSNPATYTSLFTPIRELFAAVPEARARGYQPGRFSFNVRGGRCETCQGEGHILIEMQFLPDVTVPCEICKGKRYNREALEILFKGKTIADILSMTVDEACIFFHSFHNVKNKLETLKDVGLGYIRLGQPAPTLSGGEAQRVKLATELSRRSTWKTLYILDEPTTGLSFADIDCLLIILHRLADGGNTVVIIEHNLDVIKNADYIIDLGPGAGQNGGNIVATGTPEEIAHTEGSFTGKYLRDVLNRNSQQYSLIQ